MIKEIFNCPTCGERMSTGPTGAGYVQYCFAGCPPADDTRYDYDTQAWTRDGIYATCGHDGPCNCYGKAHAGESACPDPTAHRGLPCKVNNVNA